MTSRRVRVALALGATLLAVVAGVMLSARHSTAHSTLARRLASRGADIGDQHLFPAIDLVGIGLRTDHRDAEAVLRGLRRHP